MQPWCVDALFLDWFWMACKNKLKPREDGILIILTIREEEKYREWYGASVGV